MTHPDDVPDHHIQSPDDVPEYHDATGAMDDAADAARDALYAANSYQHRPVTRAQFEAALARMWAEVEAVEVAIPATSYSQNYSLPGFLSKRQAGS